MRLPLIYKLAGADGQEFKLTAVMGDAIRAERRFKMGAASMMTDPVYVEPIAFMLHSRLTNLQAQRGDVFDHGPVAGDFDAFLEEQLTGIALTLESGSALWLGRLEWQFGLVGDADERTLEALPFDMVRAERKFGARSGELVDKAEVHGFMIHGRLLSEARRSGAGSVLALEPFLQGIEPGSLEWVEFSDDDDDDAGGLLTVGGDDAEEPAPGATALGPFA